MRGRQQRGLAFLAVLILALCSGPFVAGPDQGDAAAKALEAVTQANIGLGYLQQGNPGKALAAFKFKSWVQMTAGGITRRQQVMPTRSYLSQIERTIIFGLCKAEQVDKLVVHWTAGTITDVDVPTINRVIRVRKPAQ